MKQAAGHQVSSSPIPGLGVIVMAAGLGKRMNSNQTKVLHHVAGRAMVLYAVDVALRLAGHRSIAVVVGHQADRVRKVIEAGIAGRQGAESLHIVEQAEQLGTGHAVMQSRSMFLAEKAAKPTQYLILNGDTPLMREQTARDLLQVHQSQGATVTILTAKIEDPTGYGRVIRRVSNGPQGTVASSDVLKIVEDRDATPVERGVKEINVGTYVVSGDFLFAALDKLEPDNAQGEFYLTDIVHMAVAQGRRVAAVTLQDPDEGLGVNTRHQLAAAERVVRQQIRERWLDAGVTMRDPSSVWLDAGVTIGKDTLLYPNVTLEGRTVIGEGTTIRSGVRIADCVIGDRVEILDSSVLCESHVDDDAHLGPFVHLRPGVVVRRKAKVGNFVEMKKTELGEGSKANHLSYLGDAMIAEGVNIGAGTITCNYDGVRKHKTVIGKNVFLGSDTQLVAPVTVGDGSVVAAGTTVTQDVPPDSLAIARVAQMNRVGWVAKRRAMLAVSASNEKSAGVDEASKATAKKTLRRTKKGRAKSGKR